MGPHLIAPPLRAAAAAVQHVAAAPRPTKAIDSLLPLHSAQEPTLYPAALSAERVRGIEQYRTRFRQHCMAARESGIDQDGHGSGIVSTWLVWPHIADAISMAVVES